MNFFFLSENATFFSESLSTKHAHLANAAIHAVAVAAAFFEKFRLQAVGTRNQCSCIFKKSHFGVCFRRVAFSMPFCLVP